MCLGHAYIVLEPVGSARLTFDDDLYYELCDLMYRCLFGVPDEITDMTRSLKWSRGKNSYIGRLHLDIEMVPSDSCIFPEYREVTGTPGRSNGPIGPYWRRGERPRER